MTSPVNTANPSMLRLFEQVKCFFKTTVAPPGANAVKARLDGPCEWVKSVNDPRVFATTDKELGYFSDGTYHAVMQCYNHDEVWALLRRV